MAMDEYLFLEGQSMQLPVDDGNPLTSVNVHSIPGAMCWDVNQKEDGDMVIYS